MISSWFLLIEKQNNLVCSLSHAFSKQRRDDVGYRQISANGDAWETAPFEKCVRRRTVG